MSDRVRKPNSRYSEKVEEAFRNAEERVNALKKEINTLEKEIKTKAESPQNKDEGPKRLSYSDIVSKKEMLVKKRFELKKIEPEHKRLRDRFRNVKARVTMAYNGKITAANKTIVLAREAKNQKDVLCQKVTDLVNSQNGNEAHRKLELDAINNGVRFRAELDKLVKAGLAEDDRKLLNAASKIKTGIYQEIRKSFGWENKTANRIKY